LGKGYFGLYKSDNIRAAAPFLFYLFHFLFPEEDLKGRLHTMPRERVTSKVTLYLSGSISVRRRGSKVFTFTQKKLWNPCYQIGYCTEDISTGATLVYFCLQQHVLPSQSMR
jgi:hypothetical protein